MRKFFNWVLSAYSESHIDLQLKARFFLIVCLSVLTLCVLLTFMSSCIQIMENGRITDITLITVLVGLSLAVFSIFCMLVKGRFYIAAHMIVGTILVIDWIVIIIDHDHPVARLNSIVYSVAILSLLSLVIKRHKSAIFIYGGMNILFLFLFSYFAELHHAIPVHAVVDFISDGTIATLLACFVAYSVYGINETALKRAKAEIEVRKEAEHTIHCQKTELETINRELTVTLDRMAKTARELEITNIQLKEAQTEILATNELLRESEEKFSKAFHLSPVMLSLNQIPEGRFVDVSDTFCKVLAFDRDQVVGRTSSELDLWTDPADLKRLLGQIESRQPFVEEEFDIRTRSGSVRTLLASSEFINIGQSPHMMMVATDITARKQAEAEREQLESQLRQAQKMEAVGHLAGGVAQYFNNMLSVVIGNTELIMMKHRIDDTIQRQLLTIMDTARRSADLVRQLLTFARKETITPKVMNVNDAISGMVKMLHRLIGENINLEWIPGEDIRSIMIDPTQVDQILANLMVNARDAIGGVGNVTIETHNITLDDVYCASHSGFFPGTFVMLTVSDNGCGMDKNTLTQIFEPFFTTKVVGRGTGLGLATVYGIIKQNGGFINVYSEPGKGTTFRIYLPVTEELGMAPVGREALAEPQKGSEVILFVEDEKNILEIGKSVLEQLDYVVIPASTPEQAIDLATAREKDIDLLITDVIMPQMNGRELAKRIVEIKPHIRCLYISGYTANAISKDGLLDKGIMFLAKPFSVRDLAVKVREALAVKTTVI